MRFLHRLIQAGRSRSSVEVPRDARVSQAMFQGLPEKSHGQQPGQMSDV